MPRTERKNPSIGPAVARAWGATGFLLLATGCAPVGPDYTRPEVPAPAEWSGQLEGGLTAAELDPASLSRWWEGLGDPLLSRFVETAIEANLDIRTADARLRQGRAERALARGARFPTLDAQGQGQAIPGSQLYNTGFDASWEIDVFGGRRRAIEAADADEQAAVESRRDVLVSVVAEVALNYLEVRTFQRRRALAEENLKIQEEALEIVQAQVAAGAASGLDLEQATSSAAATRAQIPSLSQNVSRAKNRLSVLMGEAPGSRSEELRDPGKLPVPPVEVALGVPADLLRRRPDVRGAERQLAARTARVGLATAELYPKFRLNGTIGIESLTGTEFGMVSPDFTWRIYDGGQTRSKIEIQDAIQEQALIAYESALLEALEDVENAVTGFAEEQVRLRSLRESEEAAARAAALASTRYEAGASSFLEVLDAQRTLVSAADSRAASEGEVVSNVIRLYKALAGGWDSEEPEPTGSQ
jgi:NodT family efflux transporter outer membrane factor (OMF) lipoprotein